MPDERTHRRLLGRAIIATAIPVGLVSATAHPALAADAAPEAPPEAGALPVASAPLLFPATASQIAAPSSTAVGPLAAEIIAESDLTQRLGEQAKALEEELTAAHERTQAASRAWEQASAVLNRASIAASPSASASASVSASVTGTPEPTTTGAPSPTATASPTTTPSAGPTAPASPTASTPGAVTDAGTALSNLAAAVRAERTARSNRDAALAAEQEVAGRHAVVFEQFQRHQTALQTLTTRNAAQLAEAQRARDEYEISLARSRGAGSSVDGMQAAPEALEAVAFALRQLGKPYAWAEEGPDQYDCSGLMWAAYRSVGVTLPRVANNQYNAGQPVLASQLLPGDMIFFSTNPYDWRQIHHVAMYIGNNQVVQAPTFGDVVKISPIWWSEYFGATRVFPAVPIPGAQPTPEATATPSPSPTASPSATGTPTAPPTTGTPSTTAPSTTAPSTTAPSTTAPTTPATTTPPPTTSAPSPAAASPSPTATASPTAAVTTTATATTSPTPAPVSDPSPPPAVSPTSTSARQARRRAPRR